MGERSWVNRPYRAWREPLSRVEYLIALEEGREVREGATDKPKAPRELLEEMLEVQEALEEAKAEGLGGDAGTRLCAEPGRLEGRHAPRGAAALQRAGERGRPGGAGGGRQPPRGGVRAGARVRGPL